MPEKIYWFQTKSTGQNFEIYWSDLSDLSMYDVSVIFIVIINIYFHKTSSLWRVMPVLPESKPVNTYSARFFLANFWASPSAFFIKIMICEHKQGINN